LSSLRSLRASRKIPGSLVGKSWFVFPTLLAEADHTSTPEPILARRGTGQSFSAAAGSDVLTCQGCLTRLTGRPMMHISHAQRPQPGREKCPLLDHLSAS
jgi:hypothetical protein